MKKLFIFFACTVLLCALLCSCGSKTGGELTEPTQGQSVTENEAAGTAAEEEKSTASATETTAETTTAEKTAAVTEKANETEKAPEKETEKAASDAPSAKELKVKYIRDNSGDYEAPTKAMIISSAEVLKALYGSSTGELAKLCEEYTEEYFKTGVLLVAFTVESSGSVSHEVTGVDNNGGKLCINIKTNVPEVGTCDMAAWQIIVEYPQGVYSGVTVNKK